jgi:hypothetical protein
MVGSSIASKIRVAVSVRWILSQRHNNISAQQRSKTGAPSQFDTGLVALEPEKPIA